MVLNFTTICYLLIELYNFENSILKIFHVIETSFENYIFRQFFPEFQEKFIIVYCFARKFPHFISCVCVLCQAAVFQNVYTYGNISLVSNTP